jgi:diguanylate cyclase (GGDEF)-like protein
MSEKSLRDALPVLDLLPEPVLWIGDDYRILWSNAHAQSLYGADSRPCYSSFHGLDRPCNEVGEPCPKADAERLGAPVSVIHAHLERAHEPGLFRVVALPVEAGGILEMHVALGPELIRDDLTGLFRREYWLEIAHRSQALLERLDLPFSLIMLDLDRFKDFNDTHGHLAGDDLLRGVGDEVRRAMRASDTGCRFGGEEILIFLPNSRSEAARHVAERICRSIAELSVETDDGPQSVSASLGAYTALPHQPLADALRCVDKALYRAKAAGRGQVAEY